MKNLRKIFFIIYIILIILSVGYIIMYYFDEYTAKKQSNLLNEFSVDTNLLAEQELTGNVLNSNENLSTTENGNIITMENENSLEQQNNERILKLEALQKINPDIVGWIEIENTNINYPVLQGVDNDYYMNHNYNKKKTASGSIFLDKNYSWTSPSSNLLIYGHNMSNGTMFQNLLKYKNKKFYQQHPIIRFTTNTEDAYYEIISVFESKVYKKSEQNVFKYYKFINAENENEYDEFVNNVKKVSLYDTGLTAEYGQQLMTLSTCAYHTKNGRFAVVARKIL